MQETLPSGVIGRAQTLQGFADDVIGRHLRLAKDTGQHFELGQAAKERFNQRLNRDHSAVGRAGIAPRLEEVGSSQMPGRQGRCLVFVVAEANDRTRFFGHRLKLEIDRRIVGGIATKDDQGRHLACAQRGRELLNTQSNRFRRLHQGHRGPHRTQHRVDSRCQRMHRRRLGITGHHDRSFARFL